MFKRNCFLFSSFVLLIIGCQQIVKVNTKKTTAESPAPLPGYYGQWLFIKTNGSNILPDMSKYQWQNGFNKRATSNALINVYEYGPSNVGGRIRAIVVDKLNPSRLIVGSASGGIFVSDNNGASWRPINDQALSPSVTGMSQNPFLPNIIYYCTGEAQGNSADLLGAGVFKSVDGGNSFTQLPATTTAAFTQNWTIKCSPKDTQTLYVGTHAAGLWRSTDGGLTFSRVYNTGIEINDLELLPDGSVLFTVKGSGVFRSASGNLGSFSKVASINSTSSARGELAVCKNFPNVVYAAISGPDNSYSGVLKDFYKSSDGGKTFSTRTNPTGIINFGFTWYCMSMTVKDNDSNAIYAGGVDIGYSLNGGLSWSSANEQHADNHIAVNSGNKMYLGSDGGLCYYDWSNLNQFTSLNNGLNITQIYAGDVSPHAVAILGGCQDNGTKEGKNLNKSFTSVFGADGGYSFYHAQTSTVKYYATQNGAVYRNGINVSNNIPTSDAKWFIHPYHVSQSNGEIMVYPSNRILYYSTNGGSSFKNLTTVSSGRLFSSATSEGNNPSVFSGGSSILVAVDSANKTTPLVKNLRQAMPLAIRASFVGSIKVVPGFRDKIYIGFNNIADSGRIYMASKVFNDTPVFTNISGNLPRGLPVNWVECDPMNPERIIFAGTDYGLYITEDGGNNWIKDTRFPSTVISNIRIHKNMKDIYFFTHGRGVFKGQINNSGFSSIEDKNDKALLALLFPNPAKDMLNISFKTAVSGTYHVYDIQGKEVLSGELNGERHTVSTSALQNGQYVIVYQTSSGTGKQKFSIMQ